MSPKRLSTACQIAFLLAVTPPLVATADSTGACAAPRPMSPDGIERQVAGLTGDTHCYRLELVTGGLWHLSIASPSTAASRAGFEILDDAGRRAALETFERSAAERLTYVPAGTWQVRVHAQDPLRQLPAYRLASRFVERGRSEVNWKSEDDGELEIEGEGLVAGCRTFAAFKSEDDGELEIEGEGLVAGCRTFATFKNEDDGELEIEGEGLVAGCRMFAALKSEDDGELEIEGEGLVAGCVDEAAEIQHALCSAGGDDHGDTLACATPMRCRAQGELANGWGDDVDVFRFRVDGWQTLEIAACGAAHGELFDAAGQRLDGASGDGGFRLVRHLGPGTYFIGIAGESDGFYGLEIQALNR